MSGTTELVLGLDERGIAGTVGERTVRAVVARLRAVCVAERVHGTSVRGATAAAAADRSGAGDRTVQAETVRVGHGVLGEPRVSDRELVQAVPVRARVQSGRSVALSSAGRFVRTHTHIQRAEGLCKGVPVHQKGHRKVSASAVLAITVLLVGRQANR